jgi:hypothetical protein
MRARAFGIVLGSFCFLLAFAGCGGGGSSAVAPLAVSGAAGAAGASPPGSPPPYPSTAGDALVYSGTLTQAFQSFPEVAVPGSSPEPVSVTTQKVTQNISVLTNQSFNGGSGLFDLHSAETDADTSGLETTTSTTDTYENLAAAGSGSQLVSYGSQFADEAGDTTTTSYAPPPILDEIPEVAGAQWANGPGATILEALAGNASGSAITVQRTVNSDGTYSENTTYPPGYAAVGFTGVGQIQENVDGSGTLAFVANGGALTIEYSKPIPQATGAPLITVAEFNGLDPTPADAPSQSFQLPTWYGAAPTFYNETDRDLGQVAVPASCGLNSGFPQQANAILRTIDSADVVIGFTEHQTTTNYVANGFGALCSVLADTVTLYYDFNGDQAFVFSAQTPLEIQTVNETLALQPTSSIAGTRITASRVQAQSHLSSLNISAALHANVNRVLRKLRQDRERSLIRAAQRLRVRGGV